MANGSKSHIVKPYSRIAVGIEETFRHSKGLRVAENQNTSAGVDAEDVVQERNIAGAVSRIVAVVTNSLATFERALNDLNDARRLRNREALPKHVLYLAILNMQIGEAARDTANALK